MWGARREAPRSRSRAGLYLRTFRSWLQELGKSQKDTATHPCRSWTEPHRAMRTHASFGLCPVSWVVPAVALGITASAQQPILFSSNRHVLLGRINKRARCGPDRERPGTPGARITVYCTTVYCTVRGLSYQITYTERERDQRDSRETDSRQPCSLRSQSVPHNLNGNIINKPGSA